MDSKTSADNRAGFSYVLAGTLGVSGAYTAKALVNQFLSSWSASQVRFIEAMLSYNLVLPITLFILLHLYEPSGFCFELKSFFGTMSLSSTFA